MKYIITENRLNNIIFEYLDDMFPVDKINYTEGHDDNGNPDDSFYTFYFEDYDADVDDGTIFRWYSKKYWDGDSPLTKSRIMESPMLIFESYSDMDRLDAMFGDHWKPVFKQWFYEHFGFEIKTIN